MLTYARYQSFSCFFLLTTVVKEMGTSGIPCPSYLDFIILSPCETLQTFNGQHQMSHTSMTAPSFFTPHASIFSFPNLVNRTGAGGTRAPGLYLMSYICILNKHKFRIRAVCFRTHYIGVDGTPPSTSSSVFMQVKLFIQHKS